MTLPTHEFIRRFLTHVLPKGLHRIRHYGLFANGNRAANIARARELLAVPSRAKQPETSATAAADEPRVLPRPCRCCGGRMIIMRPPQQGHGRGNMRGSSDAAASGVSGCSERAGTASNWRAWAMLAIRLPLASSP